MKYIFVALILLIVPITAYTWETIHIAENVYSVIDFGAVVDTIKTDFENMNCTVINISRIEWETHKEYGDLFNDMVFFISPMLARDHIVQNVSGRLFTVWITANYLEDNSFIMTIVWFTDCVNTGNIHQALYIIPQ